MHREQNNPRPRFYQAEGDPRRFLADDDIANIRRGAVRLARDQQSADVATAMIGGTCFILLILFIAAAYAVIWIRG